MLQEVHDKIKGAGGNVELHVYDKVGHAYMNGFTADAVKKMEAMKLPVGRLPAETFCSDLVQHLIPECWACCLPCSAEQKKPTIDPFWCSAQRTWRPFRRRAGSGCWTSITL